MREHTAADGLLEIEITPATPDLVCWLWAAFPQRRGDKLDTTRIATALGVSPSTVRRWIRNADSTELNDAGMRILRRRAILRGRGRYLWPPVDSTTLARSIEAIELAGIKLEHGATVRDDELGRTMEHQVVLMYFPRAHTYGISYHRHESDLHGRKSMLRLDRVGEPMQVVTLPTLWHAINVKERVLADKLKDRCIAPRSLVKVGRTTTWLESAGPVNLNEYITESGSTTAEAEPK